MASLTCGSLLKVAVMAPIGPRPGIASQTINHGSMPRITNTAKRIPQNKNHFRARGPIVPSTSAFMTALSTLLIASNKVRPAIVNREEKMFILVYIVLKNKAPAGAHGGPHPDVTSGSPSRCPSGCSTSKILGGPTENRTPHSSMPWTRITTILWALVVPTSREPNKSLVFRSVILIYYPILVNYFRISVVGFCWTCWIRFFHWLAWSRRAGITPMAFKNQPINSTAKAAPITVPRPLNIPLKKLVAFPPIFLFTPTMFSFIASRCSFKSESIIFLVNHKLIITQARQFLFWSPRQESNLHPHVRSVELYPLSYEERLKY